MVSATRLSQSPRLDSDVAIHSRRKGRMDSTLAFAVLAGDRKFTALGYPITGPQRRFHQRVCPASRPYLPRCAPGRRILASHYFCG